jgi:hypothetical protein
MPTKCFIKKGSNPTVCGVHKVRLIERQSVENRVLSRLGDFVFFVCPMSGEVLNDPPTGAPPCHSSNDTND